MHDLKKQLFRFRPGQNCGGCSWLNTSNCGFVVCSSSVCCRYDVMFFLDAPAGWTVPGVAVKFKRPHRNHNEGRGKR